LLRELEARCRRAGLSCALNEPFAGSYVPMSRFRKDRRVVSVMIEAVWKTSPSGSKFSKKRATS